MTAQPSVYIIILNWNGWQDTVECLDSLLKATYRNFSVVLVDNASKNDSVERIKNWAYERQVPVDEYELQGRTPVLIKKAETDRGESGFKRLHLLCSGENLGFCAGNNAGMEFAVKNGADYLLILNNDTVCEPDFIEPMVEVAERNRDASLVGGVICYAEAPEIVWFAGGRFNSILETRRIGNWQPLANLLETMPEPYYETEWISGCMTLIPQYVYKELGGYNEDFFIWTEEWDLSLRARKAGYKLYVATGSRIYHKAGMSLGRITPLTHYYANRNRLILKKLYLRGLWKWVFWLWHLASRVFRYTEFALKGRFDLISAGIDAIKDYFKGRYGKWDKHKG